MCRLMSTKGDRGAASLFIIGLLVSLMAIGGIAVDVTNLVYQDNRVQNSVDNAALAIAQNCANGTAGCSTSGAATTASNYATDNSGAGTAVTDSAITGQDVHVEAEKDVSLTFLGLIPGLDLKTVHAEATASFGDHPTEGYPVLPLGVGYCTWANHAATTAAGNPNDRITIRTDLLQSLRNMLNGVTSTYTGLVEIEGLLDALGTEPLEECSDGTNELVTLKGGVWLTGEHIISGTLSGLFNYPPGDCELNVGNDLSTFVGGVQGFAFLPPGCPSRFGAGKPVDIGKTVLLPIYKPSTSMNRLGLKAGVCTSVLAPKPVKCASIPPEIGVKITGFAPFKITGWKYPGNPTNNDPTVGCVESTAQVNLYNIVNGLLTSVERILNSALLASLQLLGSNGNLTASLSCNGLQGYFVKSATIDPNFEYGPGGEDHGATAVRLSE